MDAPDQLRALPKPDSKLFKNAQVPIRTIRPVQGASNLIFPSAGLPYFCTGLWKNWGRDTFISFKAFFLQTKLFDTARSVLLTYARYVRHGLVPNMLDPARFNSRDATWWYFKAVADYISFTSDADILKSSIDMVFLSDDQDEHKRKKARGETLTYALIDLLQLMMQSHSNGITFREWNAPEIDPDMNPEGFNINLKVDWTSGFVMGGSKFNCLTWMDKMGSSLRAGNFSVPATPRAGAPIEITALLYLAVDFMRGLYDSGNSKYSGVIVQGASKQITFADWKNLIKTNFEKCFWIPKNTSSPGFKINPSSVRKTEIYKDCYSGLDTDYQLRPNALIAIGLASDLVTTANVLAHLQHSSVLFEPKSIGVKSLDPDDEVYRSYYNNSQDSDDFYSARGFSYHNGPEWIWPFGYYVISCLRFGFIKKQDMKSESQKNYTVFSNHVKFMESELTGSLPELTNGNGSYCSDSCWSQLWSVATILESIRYLEDS